MIMFAFLLDLLFSIFISVQRVLLLISIVEKLISDGATHELLLGS